LELLDEQRKQIDQAITELMQHIPQHITSIPGVGPITGATILAEICDIQRFKTVDKLVAYAGIDASVYQTGQFQASEAHMSKQGSPYPRHARWPPQRFFSKTSRSRIITRKSVTKANIWHRAGRCLPQAPGSHFRRPQRTASLRYVVRFVKVLCFDPLTSYSRSFLC
jgi:transposase